MNHYIGVALKNGFGHSFSRSTQAAALNEARAIMGHDKFTETPEGDDVILFCKRHDYGIRVSSIN